MKNTLMLVTLLGHLFIGCTSAKTRDANARGPSSQSGWSELVTAAQAGDVCDAVSPGGACLTSWYKANAFCQENRAHLPTAKEYVFYLTQFKTRYLSAEDFAKHKRVELNFKEIEGLPRKNGYYKVACQPNPDGTDDTFYVNDFFYDPPSDLTEFNKIWTATSPPGHDNAAHVVYDQWGGGGGQRDDHLKTTANAFRCVSNAN